MNTKKFLAKERIIWLGFILSGLLIAYAGDCLNQQYIIKHISFADKKSYELPSPVYIVKRAFALVDIPRYSTPYKFGKTVYIQIENFGEYWFLIGYPVYSIFRIILWPVKKAIKKIITLIGRIIFD